LAEQELRDALEGLYAYDTGSHDSGIHDEALRQRCIAAIKAMPIGRSELVPRLWLSRLIRDMWLSEDALNQGYGIEDAISFLKWLEERMEVPGL
jgi:hypothetical protein